MPETLEKLRPDRDLQCYFERPSAVAALSEVSADGFTISGCFRQPFDWAVLEWNRDNTFEHPAFRNLPDGDLSGLVLTYEETRENCIPLDSDLFPTVDWPYLRIWTDGPEGAGFYKVRLRDHAEPAEGDYVPAQAEFELCGLITPGDYIGLAWLWEHHTYQALEGDNLETVCARIVESVNAFSTVMRAERTGARIRLIYVGYGQSVETSVTGANGNRLGAYGFVAGAKTAYWQPWYQRFRGGKSPTKWRVRLDFRSLCDIEGRLVPTRSIRKLRWTYAADLQDGDFQACEFRVRVSNWKVEGTGRQLYVAGPNSYRVEDDSPDVVYSGQWAAAKGNFSGGSIHFTTQPGAGLRCVYRANAAHQLYLGGRRSYNSGEIEVRVDEGPPAKINVNLPGEDVLVRILLGQYAAGAHTVEIRHVGPEGAYFYFDFLEVAVPSSTLPALPEEKRLALATDWDTDHSMAVAPERTAWMIYSLGMHARVNHYAGALWFYQLKRVDHRYASVRVVFSGTPEFSAVTELRIGRTDQPLESEVVLTHLNLIGDTPETIAKAFELEINRGYTAIRAEAQGPELTIFARLPGEEGNRITVRGNPSSGPFVVEVSSPHMTGGQDGRWVTDLDATPRLNRAARDWHRSYLRALKAFGLEAVVAFSMELQHGDTSEEAGIAQRYPDGTPCLLNTPALQTNFSPASIAFWKEVYREMAGIMAEAGLRPYLQFGEVQWWYFPNASGMPYYDAYTRDSFRAAYGRDMKLIKSPDASPLQYPEEAAFLAGLIEAFTEQVMAHVRQFYPDCRFEVLYPTDVNEPQFNRAVNLPECWNTQRLDCFKTESFLHTYARNLDKARESFQLSRVLGFPSAQRAHLIGVSDYTTPWLKEARLARAEGLGLVVLFALDQFCLIGYRLPLPGGMRRAVQLG